MKIRHIGFSIFLALFWVLGFAQSAFEEGKEYKRKIINDENVMVKDFLKEGQQKVQVIEFFSYGCHWCQKLDPYLEKARKNLDKKVEFQRIPVEFQPAWGNLTKAYFAQQALKAESKIHQPLFEAIQSQKITDTGEETLRKFFVAQGVKAEDFNKTFNSFNVANKQKWASIITQAYQITSVPQVIVQGPAGIFTTSVRLSGSEEKVIEVMNFLIKRQEEALAKAAKSS